MGYYDNRYVYCMEYTNENILIETNYRRNECYVFCPNPDKPDDYLIYLRKLDEKPLDKERMTKLSNYLNNLGLRSSDFINPFTRTRNIVRIIDYYNKREKNKNKTK